MYGKVKRMSNLRYLLTPILEMFHPFKHLCELIWREPLFFRPYFAPFIHMFFKSKVYIKHNLKHIESYLMVFSMAYSKIREMFLQLLPTLDPDSDIYNHAQNFFALNEFFIPLVPPLTTFTFLGTTLWSGDSLRFATRFPENLSSGSHCLRNFQESRVSRCNRVVSTSSILSPIGRPPTSTCTQGYFS